jgi:UDP-N-acetylmuramoyl-tripeptide--D-alanyl-D-alanine ligase
MTAPLWTWPELVAATDGTADGAPVSAITGFSIDTRTLAAGDMFVALKDQRDGHDFVPRAFAAGAAGAIVRRDYQRQPNDGALLRVDDPLAALVAIGRAARRRLSDGARVVAVTGSAGKTGTKEMLRACFSSVAPGRVHASEKSYNNHWGVPLTLARMPDGTQYAVFEIGMNHADEIRPLTHMVQPHVAIVTTVEAVHAENFPSVEAIADAKAEIFEGLVRGGVAIIKFDNPHAQRLRQAAERCGAQPVTFGLTPAADVAGEMIEASDAGSRFAVNIRGQRLEIALAMPGRHVAENALAVVAALDAAGVAVSPATRVLGQLAPPPGRGARTRLRLAGGDALLIDESYNANPASMRAAMATLGAVPRDIFPRRILVLGDMLELGADAGRQHLALADVVIACGTDLCFACGPLSRSLFDALPERLKGGYAGTSKALEPALLAAIQAGDVVMLKASNGTRLGLLVEALKTKFAPSETRP